MINPLHDLPADQLARPHVEYGGCPLGDDCPCWQEGWRDAIRHVNGKSDAAVNVQGPKSLQEAVLKATQKWAKKEGGTTEVVVNYSPSKEPT